MKNIKYEFIPQGAVIELSESSNLFIYKERNGNSKEWISDCTVIVDTGNKLQKGIIDHHQPGSENLCVAAIIANNPHTYLEHLKTQNDITIVTHSEPDFDAIASCYLIEKFLREEPFLQEDKILSIYVNEVDSGKLTMDPVYPVSAAAVILAINDMVKNNLDNKTEKANEEILKRSYEFLGEIYRLLKLGKNIWGYDFLDSMSENFRDYRTNIEKDIVTYQLDFKERSVIDTLELLNIETNVFEPVDFICTINHKSFLWKYWVRGDLNNSPQGDGFILTCALMDKTDNYRAIIATDPTTPYNLRGLGLLLDGMEIRELLKSKDEVALKNSPREGFCRNDPWYDGRSSFHKYTIIAAPKNGSTLKNEEIVNAIKAYELWHKIGIDLNKTEDLSDFNKILEIPSPAKLKRLSTHIVEDFTKGNLETKKNLLEQVILFCENLQLCTSTDFIERSEILRIRQRLFEQLLSFYEDHPKKEKESLSYRIVGLLNRFFPVKFMQEWILRVSYLPPESLWLGLQSSFKHISEKDRHIYLSRVQNNHHVAAIQLLESKDFKNEEQEFKLFQEFFDFHAIPKTHISEYEDNPLFLYKNLFQHVKDIAICESLGYQTVGEQYFTNILLLNDLDNLDDMKEHKNRLKNLLNELLKNPSLGDNYENLRQKRTDLLSSETTNSLHMIKRYSVSRLVGLSCFDLNEVISLMFSGLDTDKELVSAYLKDLLLLLSIKRFESLIERYFVFQKLKKLVSESNQSSPSEFRYNAELKDFYVFLYNIWEFSYDFIDYEEKGLLVDKLKLIVLKLNQLKTRSTVIPAFSELSEMLFKFFSKMLEEQEIKLDSVDQLLEVCFDQYDALKDESVLMSKVQTLPVYFRHIIYEVLLALRRHYKEKIHFFQNQFNIVLESDSSSSEDSKIYLDFCNEILLRTIKYDWDVFRKKIFIEKNSNLIIKYYASYFSWQRKVLDYKNLENRNGEKDLSTINSEIRSSKGKIRRSWSEIVESLPVSIKQYNFIEHHKFLSYNRDVSQDSNYLPLYLYCDTYNYLIDSYIEKFDITNVSQSISAFSTNFPRHIRWFTNTSFIRFGVLTFITLLFLIGVFDPTVYEFNGASYRPPLTEKVLELLGSELFSIFSGLLVTFWTGFIGIAFLAPVAYLLYKPTNNLYNKWTSKTEENFTFLKSLQRIESKSINLLYLTFIVPLILIAVQIANPNTINMINNFEGLRLISVVIMILMLTIYSIYLDVSKRNPLKPKSWILSRTNHMFWLYGLQTLVITVFVVDFLLRFELSMSLFDSPTKLINFGISKYIVLDLKWFDIVIMPLFTIFFSLLSLFFSFFINRIFK